MHSALAEKYYTNLIENFYFVNVCIIYGYIINSSKVGVLEYMYEKRYKWKETFNEK